MSNDSLACTSEEAPLVSVAEDRWCPVRAGLLNVWQYADEVLQPERGRLVLFGPNGSGKTMALELLLPHLLDARGQPGRLSTSGSDRGGLWERVTGYREGEPRTGYLWLEHRRSSGEAFTVGVRLRARPSGGGEKHWFTTPLRVGLDFSLLDEHRRPLSVERLAEAIGPAGKVWGADTAGYRHAVRTTLFPGWAEDRLDALIRTLLVVRKQNVTDGLSPSRLSALLSEALPPLDDLELGRVADGFADLDRRRDHIAQLEEDIGATRKLEGANRAYARAVTARSTGDVVAATTALDNVTKEMRRLTEQLATYEREVADIEARGASLDREDQGLVGRLDGLESSEAYRRGAELTHLRDGAAAAERRAHEAQEEARAANERASERRKAATVAAEQLERAKTQLHNARRTLEQSAERLDAPPLAELSDGALAGSVATWISSREKAIQAVRACLEALRQAIQGRDAASRLRDDCEDACTRAEETLREAVAAEERAIARWRDAVAAWRQEALELGGLLGALDDPTTAASAVAEARSRARDPLVARLARVDREHGDLEAERDARIAEREAWVAGKDPEPEPPSGRRDRGNLEGAPLWRLVQFHEGVPDPVRGAVESALAEARLLDAWVAADGEIHVPHGESDVVLDLASTPSTSSVERTLASLLEPDPAIETVELGAVQRLLSEIPLVDRNADECSVPAIGLIVGEDGTWRTPRLAGRAPACAAQYIGASSRAAARRARIAALDEEIARLETSLATLQREREALDQRLRSCDEEARSFPPTGDVEQARREVDDARVREETTREALVKANNRLTAASERVTAEQRKLNGVASGHALPTEPSLLDEIETRLRDVDRRVSVFETNLDRAKSAETQATTTHEVAVDAEARAREASERAGARAREHDEAASRFAAVQEAIGADYQQVVAEILDAKRRRTEIAGTQKELRAAQRAAEIKAAKVSAQRENTETKREEAAAHRERATASFLDLCRDGLVSDAGIPAPTTDALTSATAILEAARRVRATGVLPPAPDEARLVTLSNTVMARVSEASRQLAGRADLTFETSERGWSILRARREGLVSSAPELLDGLREDLEAARSELTKKQQELFERILSGSVREHLKERLWAAQALVDRINGLLGQVRTESGGVRVDLKWEIDPDQPEAAELRRAKELLLHDSPVAQGRADLDAFLRSRIEQIRAAEDDTGEWRERLARMLDYRQWHRFRVLVHHNRFGDTPRALDSKKVSLSAGEKTIVMVLPLLAAVTAHYEPPPGEPPCSSPRFLLMDELFPKLDFPNKRKLMGLLPRLHLDAVFTSDKDRCEYDTLDGIAIHVFQKHGDDQTTTTRLVWNGSETRVCVPADDEHTEHDVPPLAPVPS